MKRVMVALTAALVVIGAFAETETVDGITWNYTVSDGKAEVGIGGLHPMKAVSTSTTGAITIPSTLGGYPVTSIGDRAFEYCSGLTSVTIPSGVTGIGDYAFLGCSGLWSFSVAEGNLSYKSVSGLLLTKDGKMLVKGVNGDVTIPASVTSIGENAFDYCRDLTSVTIPDGVTSIGYCAFRGCSGLTSVTIPPSVTSIGDYAFSGCSGLWSFSVAEGNLSYKSVSGLLLTKDGKMLVKGVNGDVTIPDSVTTIVDGAFSECDSLASVTIPASVTSIGDGAFSGCDSLASVTIPNSVTSMGDYAFSRCYGLTSVTIGNSVTSIGEEAFDSCYNLTSVTIGNGVTNIGYYAFSNCHGLTSVTIPDGVTCIGYCAFENCHGLTSVTIPDSVTTIVDGTFSECYGLTSVTIGNSVTSIWDYAFYSCYGLTSVTIPASVMSIGAGAFCNCGLASVVLLGDAPTVGEDAFLYEDANCTAYVRKDSTGWDVTIPGMWNGLQIEYVSDDPVDPDPVDPDPVDPDPVDPEPVDPEPVDPDPVDPDPVDPDPVKPDPVNPGYEVLDEKDIVAPYDVPKAVTIMGAVYDGCDLVGIVELKLGKVNAKKGTGKVSGSFVDLDGKKHTIKGPKLEGINGTAPLSVALDVKDFGAMSVTIGGERFAGSLGPWHVQSANVGGDWTGRGATVTVDADDLSMFAGTVLEKLLPNGEQATVNGGKWSFAKAASVKWGKPKNGSEPPEFYDGESGKGLFVDTSKGKTNLSGIKLTYTPKKGTFKGPFKVYALEGAGKSTKLKKYTVKVNGVVVGGVGYGVAICKKPALRWSVSVR